jgi:hypothetical protein
VGAVLVTPPLRGFADELGQPAVPVLWPEHRDLGITVDAVDYGVSPAAVSGPAQDGRSARVPRQRCQPWP